MGIRIKIQMHFKSNRDKSLSRTDKKTYLYLPVGDLSCTGAFDNKFEWTISIYYKILKFCYVYIINKIKPNRVIVNSAKCSLKSLVLRV